jgi:hypothetical protein
MGPGTVLDAVVKRKVPSPHRESNPRTPIVQPKTQSYTELSQLPMLHGVCLNKLLLHMVIFCLLVAVLGWFGVAVL